ncbi:MAG: hypothetical protein QW745_02845 [Thermoplasmata archaeon]
MRNMKIYEKMIRKIKTKYFNWKIKFKETLFIRNYQKIKLIFSKSNFIRSINKINVNIYGYNPIGR